MLNLDTHIVLRFMDQELEENLTQILQKTDQFCISPIVLWEMAMLKAKNRIEFDFDSIEWKTFFRSLKILPLTQEVALQSAKLDFKSDPADQIIAATSIVTGIPLLTKDRMILTSKIVPFAS